MGSAETATKTRSVVIVVCNKGIGDAVEALPVFEMVRRFWPHVYLGAAFFNSGTQKQILGASPHISQTIRLHGSVKDPWLALEAGIRNFKVLRRFDTILFLYKKEKVSWPLVVTAKCAGLRVLHKHRYRYADQRRNTYSDFPEHVFFQIVASNLLLGLPLSRLRKLRMDLSEQDKSFAAQFFMSRRLGGRPTVIINTRGIDQRNWGIHRFAQVANSLEDWGADVLINGGSEDQLGEFQSVFHTLDRRVILLEKPSPCQLAAVIEKCNLFIGEPSGPTSLAMAVGTPTISLQGPGEYDYPGQERIGPVWWPRDPKHQFVEKIEWCQANLGVRCRCCHRKQGGPLKRAMKRVGLWAPWKKIRKGVLGSLGVYRHHSPPDVYPCLEAITVEEVVELAKKQLRSTKLATPCDVFEAEVKETNLTIQGTRGDI